MPEPLRVTRSDGEVDEFEHVRGEHEGRLYGWRVEDNGCLTVVDTSGGTEVVAVVAVYSERGWIKVTGSGRAILRR